jgi:hypothetical protein
MLNLQIPQIWHIFVSKLENYTTSIDNLPSWGLVATGGKTLYAILANHKQQLLTDNKQENDNRKRHHRLRI